MNITSGRPLTDILRDLEGGMLVQEGTEKLAEVLEAVMATRKVGGLTITLAFSATGRGNIEVGAKIKATIPEDARPSTTFFVDKHNNLVRNDPNQPSLPLKAVPEAPRTVREVMDKETGELRQINE